MKTPVLPVPAQTVKYSTTTSVVKPMDIFDFFTDLVCEKPGKPSIPEPDSEMIPDNKQKSTSKVDNILADINTKNPYVTSKMLMSALTTGINTKNYSEVNKIINFCIDKQIPLPSALVSMIASKYSNIGLVESLATVQTLCKLTDEKEYYRKGEFLHHLALCYWIKGNCTRCIELLRECSSKYPSLNDTTKKVLKCVIPEAVSSRSQAQLVNITDFIKEFARRFGDFYPMTLLWNQLFLSCWYTDQELADQLLDSDENLQRCVSLLVPSLVPYLIKKNQVPDVYRFLQILLKYKFMDEYSTTLQILFDYYCKSMY